jgi:hypothetical protein
LTRVKPATLTGLSRDPNSAPAAPLTTTGLAR